MNQSSQNVVRLESSRSGLIFGLVVCLLLTSTTAAGSLFFLGYAAEKGPDFWLSIVFGVVLAAITSLFIAFEYRILRLIRVPDVLEFSRDQLHYVSVTKNKEFSVPWSKVGPAVARAGRRSNYVYFEAAGKPQRFSGGYFDVSIDTLAGMINSARQDNTSKGE